MTYRDSYDRHEDDARASRAETIYVRLLTRDTIEGVSELGRHLARTLWPWLVVIAAEFVPVEHGPAIVLGFWAAVSAARAIRRGIESERQTTVADLTGPHPLSRGMRWIVRLAPSMILTGLSRIAFGDPIGWAVLVSGTLIRVSGILALLPSARRLSAADKAELRAIADAAAR